MGDVGDLSPGTHTVMKQRFSASPPRVELDGLIKSGRSSYASAGTSEPSEVEAEIRTEDVGGEKVDSDVQATTTKPRNQLFKWFQPTSLGGKKRGRGAQEQESEERVFGVPGKDFRGIGVSPSADTSARDGEVNVGEDVKVVNPDEIELDDDEDEEKEVKTGDVVPAPDNSPSLPPCSSSASSTAEDIKIQSLKVAIEHVERATRELLDS